MSGDESAAPWGGDEAGWRGAAADLAGGVRRAFMWSRLGWLDVRQRYSGSVLGSVWLTTNVVLIVGCLTFVLAGPLGSRPGPYAAYVTIGLVLWGLVQTAMSEAPTAFVAAAEPLRQCTLPASVHIFRLLWRNLIVFAHSAVLIPIVLLLFRIRPGAAVWTVIPAFLLLVLALSFGALLLALLGARFRDVPQVVTNGLQLLFFATPVFWLPSALPPGRAWLLQMNPFFAFLDIVRTPILGGAPAASSWPVAASVTLVTGLLAAVAYARWRQRIVYWI
jgi:ABC-type polysaccharide/polyol phosphate export permease